MSSRECELKGLGAEETGLGPELWHFYKGGGDLLRSEWHSNHLGCSSQPVFPGTPALPLSICVSSGSPAALSLNFFVCKMEENKGISLPGSKVRIIKRKMKLDYVLAHK